jgi:hypothetical protein
MIEEEEGSVLSFAKMLKDVIDHNVNSYINTVREDAGAAIKLREVCDKFRCFTGLKSRVCAPFRR